MAHVSGLRIYPVKSLRGVDVHSANVEKRGLAGDRRWMLVKPDGKFLTQRDEPSLARIKASLVGDAIKLEAEGFGEAIASQPEGELFEVTVWNDTVGSVDAGDTIADWITSVVGFDSRLVFMPVQTQRQVWPQYAREGDVVGFADAFPVLLANRASLDDLNDKLDAPVPLDRFRANIVVDGFDAFQEDVWTKVTIGPVTFRNAKRCGRCLVTTTDQETGERRGPEPIATLSKYRLIDQIAVFGTYLIPDSQGEVRVGDEVIVE